MKHETVRASGVITLVESSLRTRLLGIAVCAGAAVGAYMAPDLGGRIVAGMILVAGLGLALSARSRTVVCNPRSGEIRLIEQGITGENTRRVPIAHIRTIRLETLLLRSEPHARTFRLVAALTTGESVALSSNSSWQRRAKQAAGDALARALGIPFEN